MGFKLPKRTALVEWEEGHDYHGLQVRLALDAPMSLLFMFQRVAGDEGEAENSIRTFGDRILQSWNLTDDDDQPVPANGDGLVVQPFRFASELIAKWTEVTTQPSAPLAERSPNGSTSLEPSIPMEALSGSRPN